MGKNSQKNKISQLDLGLNKLPEPDRNWHKGGRSFYFFDFDDNVARLPTAIVLFHNQTGEEQLISSREFALQGESIGKEGRYHQYHLKLNDETGSFRFFRDQKIPSFQRILGKKQIFVNDVQNALFYHEDWRAPSWKFFHHAVYNQRAISIITARGHEIQTIKDGIKEFRQQGHLEREPNYLGIFPVSNPEIREKVLGDKEMALSIPELKRRAIRKSVLKAIELYGDSPHHRFGMSDDDPKNIEIITDEFVQLKKDFPEMAFFVIETKSHECEKREVLLEGFRSMSVKNNQQLSLL